VQISGDAPVYGIELHLRFEPALVEVVDADPPKSGVQVQAGSLFSARQIFAAMNAADNAAGRIEYAVTLMGEPQGVTQGGSVILITFRGRAAGVATIALEALASDAGGSPIPAVVEGGTLSVTTTANPAPGAQPSPPATATPAPTAVAAPTVTAARPPATAQPAPTSQPEPGQGQTTVQAPTAEAPATATTSPSATPAAPRATVGATATLATPITVPTIGAQPTETASSTPVQSTPAQVARTPTAPAVVPASSGSRGGLVTLSIAAGVLFVIGALAGVYVWRYRGRADGTR